MMNAEVKKKLLNIASSMFGKVYENSHMTKSQEFDDLHKVYIGAPREGGDRSSDSEATPVSNHCFKNVEILNALMRDMTITARVYPRFDEIESPDFNIEAQTGSIYNIRKHAESKQRLLDFIWRESKIRRATDAASHDGFEYGTGRVKVFYDPTGRNGNGIIKVSRVALQNLVVADPCVDDIQRQPWVAEIVPMTYAEVCRMYEPSKEDKERLRGGLDYRNETSFVEDAGLFPIHAGSGIREYQYTSLTNSEMIAVVQFHVKYFETLENEFGTEYDSIMKKKYANGMIITYSRDIILDVSPFYDHGMYPYAEVFDYEQPGKAYGIGEVHIAEHINSQINEMWGIIQDNIFTMGNGKILTEEDVDIVIDDTSAGAIIRVKKGAMTAGKIQFLPGLTVPSDHFNYVAAKISELESITGINEILSGRPPGSGVDAAKAINTLASMASQRIRPKILNVSNFITDVARLVLALAIQYYESRMINIIGQQGAVETLSVDSLPGESLDWYTVDVEGGGSLPVSRAAYVDTIVQLSQVPLEAEGLIDTETLFEALELPRRYELLKKIEQRREANQQRQRELVEAQATAGARMQAQNNTALIGSDDPNQVMEGLQQMGIGG